MMRMQQLARNGAMAIALATAAACSSAGALGDILGGVLGGGAAGGTQVAGTIRGVNTSSQQISLQQSNGSTVALRYDGNTKVIYQNQSYQVTALENGDQVTARVLDNNGTYYTDSVAVTSSASSPGGGTTAGNVQQLQGTVRQIDRTNGVFTMDASSTTTLTVTLPYNASSADVNKFNSMRTGDYVRFYGVFLNNTRVELRQFY